MRILRTPDDRFADLPDFPFTAHFTEIRDADADTLRIAAIDEGPRAAAPVLLMHGEPSWSYLYRKITTRLVARGHRVVAPDLVGFGRSDKPAEQADHTYERHVRWMCAWMRANDLTGITLFCQDWGGLVGLRMVAADPDRFARLVVANTGLPTGGRMTDAFKRWLDFSQNAPSFPVGDIVAGGCVRKLSAAEKAAYDAPFPDDSYKAGPRRFPALVPILPDAPSVTENRAALEVLKKFTRPVITAFSDSDPITRGGEEIFRAQIPGARGVSHVTIKTAGHFLQEDQPEQIADLLHNFIAAK